MRLDDLPQNMHNLAKNLVDAVAFLSQSKLHNMAVVQAQLTTDFIEAYAQILSALRSYLVWSPTLNDDATLKRLIGNISYTLLPPSNCAQEPKIITLAAGL